MAKKKAVRRKTYRFKNLTRRASKVARRRRASKKVTRRRVSRKVKRTTRRAAKKVTRRKRSSRSVRRSKPVRFLRYRSNTRRVRRGRQPSKKVSKRSRVKRFPKKPNPRSQGNMMSWLQSAKHKMIIPRGYEQNVSMKAARLAGVKPKRTGSLVASEYEKVIKKLYKLIGNETSALKKTEKENKLLKLELETTRERLQDMHLPVSVRRARARSLDRLSAQVVERLCTFLNDDELFSFRVLCVGFYNGYFSQEIKTARRAERANMKRIVRVARMGRVFPNVSIVLVNWAKPKKNVLSNIDQSRFPSMSELVVESAGSLNWRGLRKNPNITTFSVLNTRLNLHSVTKEKFPNLEYLTFKLYSRKGRVHDFTNLPSNRVITRIDLVNLDSKNALTVDLMRPLTKSRFPNLNVVGVLNEGSLPLRPVSDVWSYLLKKNVHFRCTCREFDFTDGRLKWYGEV